MKNLLLILLILLPVLVYPQDESKKGSKSYLEEKSGFKDLILGNDISSLSDKLIETNEKPVSGMKLYKVVDESLLKVGSDIDLKSIIVGVFDNKITALMIDMDKPNGSLIHKVFTAAYGQGERTNRYMDKYLWRTKSILLSLNYDGLSEDNILMIHRGLFSEAEAYQKQEDQKAIDDI